ncbi:hypothetical protein GE061_013861 [Apolygus lucorum]|uniref:Lipase domain-containing protein n=1 Tax=Apolygus lucorum TaxID=248454 RepID=A0A8S9XR11_APOLU|nr:hypothetical protein GE061_013861 [Apolygus lucorum]
MNYKIVLCGVLLLAFSAQSLPTESGLRWINPIDIIVGTFKNVTSGITHSIASFENTTSEITHGVVTGIYNSTVKFYLYTAETRQTPQQLWIDDRVSLKSSDFQGLRKTVVVVHGFENDSKSNFTQMIKNALLKYEDVNVIAIDWSFFTKNPNYLWVVSETKSVGEFIGQFVDFLMNQTGLSPDHVHFIGHSIGAHASGFAGKYLKGQGKTVGRISGLDPAWPGFYTSGTDARLSSMDAKFVDCIHSCGGGLGYPTAICQADFFPNGGTHVQPGCPWYDFGVCSHGRSFDYYAESIDTTHLFESQTCNSVVDGVPYTCRNEGALMGYPASPEHLGVFYLTTQSASPYAKNIKATE